ncbi:potassium voltage-gated channel subfamily E member 4 isoform X2 [Camelus ferus]|uniref:Potassium voltage-gated channel subfamily E member 4 isoform X2 n=4 Tax=Camelus TaxID=9836 RepID=A0A8B6YHT8_CAMFR|nr:potassium voltage-gated channel subfamily E member 4 isoform X2 [Camelus ferus]XP_010947161.1 potassium voltage-gated channel subfamily E member 4 isoform X2 [Camelus bactrianus]
MHFLTIYPKCSSRAVRALSPTRRKKAPGLGDLGIQDSGQICQHLVSEHRASMLRMEPLNSTHASTATPSGPLESHVPGSASRHANGNEYFYVLVVMSFYGIFLIGIMLGYMKSKRQEKKSSLLLLYKDEERLWGEAMKPLPVVSGLRSVQVPAMLNVLQESVAPALSCTLCSMEGDSVSSESSSPDVHLTIQEEGADDELEEASETPLNESSEGSSENLHQNS